MIRNDTLEDVGVDILHGKKMVLCLTKIDMKMRRSWQLTPSLSPGDLWKMSTGESKCAVSASDWGLTREDSKNDVGWKCWEFMPPFCPSLKFRTVFKKTCKCCLIQDCLSLVLVHPCQGANSNKVSNAARAAMRMWGTRPETLQENARDRSRHTTLISCHVASHKMPWETLHIIFMNLLFHSVTAWFLCTTWPFQTCISASTIHLFYFGLQVMALQQFALFNCQ